MYIRDQRDLVRNRSKDRRVVNGHAAQPLEPASRADADSSVVSIGNYTSHDRLAEANGVILLLPGRPAFTNIVRPPAASVLEPTLRNWPTRAECRDSGEGGVLSVQAVIDSFP
jgi:hypothetical protein